jgi:hypothetical protein
MVYRSLMVLEYCKLLNMAFCADENAGQALLCGKIHTDNISSFKPTIKQLEKLNNHIGICSSS